VFKRGFSFFSQEIRLDVRAMDADQVEKTVRLDAQAPGGGGTP
jgi:hypothetical protein